MKFNSFFSSDYFYPVFLFLIAFFISFLPNKPYWVILKLGLILSSTYFIIYLHQKNNSQLPENEVNSHSDDTPEALPDQIDILKIEDDKDIEKIFNHFLETMMPLLQKTTVSDTVALLMVNFQKKQFYLRHLHTNHPDLISKQNFYELNSGLPAIIMKTRTPLIENHLPEQEGLLPYYTSSATTARSFAGTPLFFNNRLVGVVCVDSTAEENYSNEDLEILSQFTNLLSLQLLQSSKLYEYETENWIARALHDFSKSLWQLNSERELWQYLAQFLKQIFNYDRILVAESINEKEGKLIFVGGDSRNFTVGQVFSLYEGLIGWIIRKKQSLLVEDFASKENYIPRISIQEFPAREFRSFLGVPVIKDHQVRVAICIESYTASAFKAQYRKIMETLAYQIATFLEKTELLTRLQNERNIDEQTGLGNMRAFQKELKKEFYRAKEFQKNLCLLLLKIAVNQSTLSPETSQKLLKEFFTIALPYLPEKDYIFRLSEDLFGIIFIEQKTRIIMDNLNKLCSVIESRQFWLDNASLKLKINGGLVQYPEMGRDVQEIYENAKKALLKSESKGQNSIELFSINN